MTPHQNATNNPGLGSPERVHNPERRQQLGESVLHFIATVSLEYGAFDAHLFRTLIDWLGPVAEELRIPATHVPNPLTDPAMPAHEVIVLESGTDFWFYTTAWNANISQPVIVCLRPSFTPEANSQVLLHTTETIFKTSLATPASPFLPDVPHWIRCAS